MDEEQLIELRQLCLNERREKEEAIAIIKEEAEAEITQCREEIDIHKERVKMIQQENERLLQMLKDQTDRDDHLAELKELEGTIQKLEQEIS